MSTRTIAKVVGMLRTRKLPSQWLILSASQNVPVLKAPSQSVHRLPFTKAHRLPHLRGTRILDDYQLWGLSPLRGRLLQLDIVSGLRRGWHGGGLTGGHERQNHQSKPHLSSQSVRHTASRHPLCRPTRPPIREGRCKVAFRANRQTALRKHLMRAKLGRLYWWPRRRSAIKKGRIDLGAR